MNYERFTVIRPIHAVGAACVRARADGALNLLREYG
jgi:hypothetical protein